MAHRLLRNLEADGWERSDFPIICESCFGDNPYVRIDLPQTFPGHPALDEGGRNALRCLLTAYARQNPSVGYCQVRLLPMIEQYNFLNQEKEQERQRQRIY